MVNPSKELDSVYKEFVDSAVIDKIPDIFTLDLEGAISAVGPNGFREYLKREGHKVDEEAFSGYDGIIDDALRKRREEIAEKEGEVDEYKTRIGDNERRIAALNEEIASIEDGTYRPTEDDLVAPGKKDRKSRKGAGGYNQERTGNNAPPVSSDSLKLTVDGEGYVDIKRVKEYMRATKQPVIRIEHARDEGMDVYDGEIEGPGRAPALMRFPLQKKYFDMIFGDVGVVLVTEDGKVFPSVKGRRAPAANKKVSAPKAVPDADSTTWDIPTETVSKLVAAEMIDRMPDGKPSEESCKDFTDKYTILTSMKGVTAHHRKKLVRAGLAEIAGKGKRGVAICTKKNEKYIEHAMKYNGLPLYVMAEILGTDQPDVTELMHDMGIATVPIDVDDNTFDHVDIKDVPGLIKEYSSRK